MENISVYLNHYASNSSHDWQAQLSRALFRSKISYHTPKNLIELNELLENDIQSEVDAVISIGGDGTVNTLIQKLQGTKIGLLVIPGGTANDLATELGNPRNIKRITHFIRNYETKDIDLIIVNEHYMATNGGLGLGGKVAHKINKLRAKLPILKKVMKLTGKKIYAVFFAREFLSPRFKLYHLELDSKEFKGKIKTAALLINNQPTLAGIFKIAPDTKNTDSKFNVSFLTHTKRSDFLRCAWRVMKGDYPLDDPDFVTFETEELTIRNLSKGKIHFFGDGEIFDEAHEWHIKSKSLALRVFAKDASKDMSDLCNEVTLS